jgi:hypothetical protein
LLHEAASRTFLLRDKNLTGRPIRKERSMGDVINLRKARKKAAREEQTKVAGQNRILHGRSNAERHSEAAAKARAERELDAHRRDDGEAG